MIYALFTYPISYRHCSVRPSERPGAARQAIVPIVYGFPSAPLTAHYRRGALVLTEEGRRPGMASNEVIDGNCTIKHEEQPSEITSDYFPLSKFFFK